MNHILKIEAKVTIKGLITKGNKYAVKTIINCKYLIQSERGLLLFDKKYFKESAIND